jgi:hypothetical protein
MVVRGSRNATIGPRNNSAVALSYYCLIARKFRYNSYVSNYNRTNTAQHGKFGRQGARVS